MSTHDALALKAAIEWLERYAAGTMPTEYAHALLAAVRQSRPTPTPERCHYIDGRYGEQCMAAIGHSDAHLFASSIAERNVESLAMGTAPAGHPNDLIARLKAGMYDVPLSTAELLREAIAALESK